MDAGLAVTARGDGEPPVLAMGELVRLLGVSAGRVKVLVGREDFPAPVAELSVGRIWSYETVAAWARATGRSVHPLATR